MGWAPLGFGRMKSKSIWNVVFFGSKNCDNWREYNAVMVTRCAAHEQVETRGKAGVDRVVCRWCFQKHTTKLSKATHLDSLAQVADSFVNVVRIVGFVYTNGP